MMRLSDATLASVPANVARPAYDRSAVVSGVVHFGPGAFHRAHQAAMFDTLLAHDPRWGITGISLNSADVARALEPQDGLYTLALLGERTDHRVVGAIGRILTADRRTAILAALTAPTTRIVSLTVTEKGYRLKADGTLDLAHPAIAADLAAPHAPCSVVGWLVAGIAARRALGRGGLTLLSCDNLVDNGRKLSAAVAAFAEETDRESARWIADNVRFPGTMVDAITPATDDALRERVAAAIGMEDTWPVQRERFAQWVIEDDFAGERPALDGAGAVFTRDVRGFEAAKLRLLNGAHSTLAYVGLALGYASVAQAMADRRLAILVEATMRQDVLPSLRAPPGLDLDAYVDAILARFTDPAIVHRLSQIAWDGSQKLPYRILDPIRDALAAGRPIDRLVVPVVAWLRFVARAAASGAAIVDPLAHVLYPRAGDWRRIVAMEAIFGTLATEPRFVEVVARLQRLVDAGDGVGALLPAA